VSFLSELLRHTKDYESPTSFWKWSAFAAIAAVLRDSVWMPDGDKKLYPNIYVLFLADSGARKGRPVDFCEELVKELAVIKCISGRSSIQGIMDELAHTETVNGKMLKGGAAIWYAPELASGIVSDEAAISILTDIYDGKTDFKNLLRHSPRFKVERIVFTAFMASNIDMIKGVYDQRATQGGLLARTFLITEQGEFRPSNALMRKVDMTESRKKVADALKAISQLQGEILFTDEAIKVYEPWYNEFRTAYRGRDKGGIAGRMHTGVKKLSCILAANDMELTVRGRHIEEAIHECLILMPNYNEFIMASGKSDISAAGAILITELQNATDFCMDKRLILRKHWQDIDIETLDKLTATLAEAGMIDIMVSHPTMFYRLTARALEMLGKQQKSAKPGQ
jgi:hypothetical protein